MHRIPGRILLIVAAFALFLVPVAAIAAGGFTDVEDDSVFIADIQWMKDTGVTKGCNPPTNDRYCPKNNVTREQMSAFMHRLAVNQIVDAATAIEANHAVTADAAVEADHAVTADAAVEADHAATADAAVEADHAASAGDADTLGGKTAGYYTTAVFTQQKEWGFDSGLIPTGSNAELLRVTHTAPTNGYVSLAYSASLHYAGVSTAYLISVAVDDVTCVAPSRDTFAYGRLDATDSYDNTASVTTIEVAAGAHTYSLCSNTENGDVDLLNASIQGFFAPKGSVATVPLAGSSGSSSSEYGDG